MKSCQKQIETTDDQLHAFLTMSEKLAIEQAQAVDKDISAGKSISLLAGVPASIKDVLMTEGIRTTAGSKILTDYKAVYDATVVARLKQAGYGNGWEK